MENHFPWILLILSFAIALSTSDVESVGPSGSPQMVELKTTILEDLLKSFNIDDLESLSPCHLKDSSCPIDKEVLLNLVEYIYQINGYVPQDIDSEDDETPSTASPDNDTVKIKLQNHLTSGILINLVMQIHGPKLRRHEMHRLKELYTIANNSYASDLNTFKQNLGIQEDKLKETLQEKTLLDQRMDIIIKEIELTLTNQEQRVDPIAAEIDQNQYSIAMAHFYQLNDTKMLIPLAERTKDNEKLLKFIKMLPSLSDRMVAYNVMVKKGNLGYSIFTLKHDFKFFKTQMPVFRMLPSVSSTNADFMQFEEELERRISRTLDLISVLIQTEKSEDYSDLIEYTRYHVEPFEAHLDELLVRVHRSSLRRNETLNSLLDFTRALPTFSLTARVVGFFQKLLDSDSYYGNSLSLKIAYQVKQITLSKNYPGLPQKLKMQLEEIKKGMPSLIKRIIWDDVCIVVNYPYSHVGLFRDDYGRVIITNHPDHWRFELSDKGYFFKIRHLNTNEYLIMTQIEDRKITTSPDHGNQYWSLELNESSKFLIKQETFNQFLSGNSYNAESCINGKSTTRDGRICNKANSEWFLLNGC